MSFDRHASRRAAAEILRSIRLNQLTLRLASLW
jgi:hypothetical protein